MTATMDGSFGSSGCFPGDRNSTFHRHSQSSNHSGLDFSLMHRGLPSGQPPVSDASRQPNGGTYESHDDLCVEHCMGVGLYNGSQHFNHRGVPAALPTRWPGRISSTHHNPGSLFDYSIEMDANPIGFRTAFAPSQSQSNLYQPWYSQQSHAALDQSALRLGDEDCNSLDSCCDSQCTMTGKCSNAACANKEDTCTDQNCPERPAAAPAPSVPSEVVDGAAALISINHAPEPPHNGGFVMNDFVFDLPSSPDQNFLWSPIVNNVATHLLAAHGDPDSSTCTRPCLLDDPRTYSNCPMPVYNNLTPFSNQYAAITPEFQFNQSLIECRAEAHDPDAYLAHFNEQHRQFFAANALNPSQGPARTAGEGVLPSIEPMSSSPTTPLDTPDSGASSNTPSPLTPMSTSADMSEVNRSVSYADRGMSVDSSEDTHIHKCLWREEDDSDPCGGIFSSPEELFNHAASIHIKNAKKGDQGFRCGWDDCPRSEVGAAGFPQRSKIERHMQTHIDHKPHICPTCHKGFSAKQALNQHMFIHTNQKPLVCNICGKAFRYPSALTMHQRVHTGEKPLKCPVCGKFFSESSNLSKHKRTHEVTGRFTCRVPGCDRNFHRQDQLRRHIKTHQKEDDGVQVDMLATRFESVFEQQPED